MTQLQILHDPDFIDLVRFFGERDHYKFIDNAKSDNPEVQKKIDLACEAVMHSFGSYEDSALGITNFLNNFPYILKSADHRELEAHVEDLICVSAGPSLDADLDALKKHADNGAFIICCDAVIKTLLKEGIIPKAVITTERYPLTLDFFKDVDLSPLKDTILVASPFSYTGILANWPHRIAFLMPVMAPIIWLPWSHPSSFQSIPAVSSVMAQFAKHLCPERIFLVGQDLAYHPTGSSHADLKNASFNGFEKPEDDPTSGTVYQAEGYHMKVLTNSFWVEFSMDLGRILKDCKTYSTAVNGLKIPNVAFKSLRETEIRPSWSPIKRTSQVPAIDLMELRKKIEEAEKEFDEGFDPVKPHASQIIFTLLVREYAINQSLVFKNPDWKADAREQYQSVIKQAENFARFFLSQLKQYTNESEG